jgi:hypothetical protein
LAITKAFFVASSKKSLGENLAYRSDREEKRLEEIRDKLEATKGVRIWGIDAGGTPRIVLVTTDGKLQCELG